MSRIMSGSSVERVVECPASAVLPSSRRTTPEAIAGRGNHSNTEDAINAGDRMAMPLVVQQVLSDEVEVLGTEIAFAINVRERTAAFLGRVTDRSYGKPDPWIIPLTLDLVTRRPGTIGVWDWKSNARVTAAADNWQLRVGSLAARWHFKEKRADIGIGYLNDNELDASTDGAERDEETLGILARTIQRVLDKDASKLHEGPWCQYCPAVISCPAKAMLVREFSGELADIEARAQSITPAQAGAAWVKLKELQKLAKRVEDAIKLRAAWDDIVLPGGKKRLKVIESTQQRFDTKKARQLLAEHDIAEPKQTVTYTQVREVKTS